MIDRLNAALEGRYRIERELGAGGMATVFLAEDVRHHRNVALKVLKPELAAVVGAERFLAEIETTAKLQHPHILPLFDSGEADSFLFYAMPYVEGESLRDRLQREQQLPLEEALGIAEKVAAALEYAHEQGVVHRDIKPANILLSRGEPLVADFGIALAVTQAGAGRITETGLSLGTPHYMSPEQAAGERSLDPRSDVYALGCVLYEMLTGQPPFGGPNAQAVLGRILTGEPEPPTVHRKAVPANVEAAVLKALERLPADRFESAEAFARALRNPSFRTAVGAGAGAAAPVSVRRWKAAAALAGVVALVAAGLAVWARLPGEPPPVIRYSMELPAGQDLLVAYDGRHFDLSPDGSRIVYIGSNGSTSQLWLRSRSRLQATPIPGTDRASSPAFSPDGSRIVYMDGDFNLGVVSVGGEPPMTLSTPKSTGYGVDWGADGYLYYSGEGGIFRILAAGGSPEQVTHLKEGERYHVYPQLLPGGRGLLYTAVGLGSDASTLAVVVSNLETGEETARLEGVAACYAASGHLLVLRGDGALLAAPFDLRGLKATGPTVSLATGINVGSAPDLAISDGGTLVYLAGSNTGGSTTPVRVSRNGTETDLDPGWHGDFGSLALSPDGSRLAVSAYSSEGQHIWIKDLVQGPLTKLTFEGSTNVRPSWTPDGRRVAFYSDRLGSGFSLWWKRADGSGQAELLEDDRQPVDAVFSPDGQWLLYRSAVTDSSGADILARRLGPDGQGEPERMALLASSFREVSPTLSPDGRWLAYMSDESGREQVYVRRFPDVAAGKWQVSVQGGNEPLWSRGGGEIFYRRADGVMVAAQVRADSTFSVGERKVLFPALGYYSDYNQRAYDVFPGDTAFVMLRVAGTGGGGSHLVVVENFFTELKEKVGG